MNETQMKLREIVELQKGYEDLESGKVLFTKQAICNLCVPFRDKHSLTDDQVLRIARKKMALSEMIDVMKL